MEKKVFQNNNSYKNNLTTKEIEKKKKKRKNVPVKDKYCLTLSLFSFFVSWMPIESIYKN